MEQKTRPPRRVFLFFLVYCVMRNRPHLAHAISVKINGKKHLGCYYHDGDSITVHYGTKGSKPTLVGALQPEACARILLLALIEEGVETIRR